MQKKTNPKNDSGAPTQANLARDNHFIPQMYQQGWSDDGKNIWEYKTLVHDDRYPAWQHRSIRRTGVRENLYVRSSDGIERDDFEHMFNERFESPAMDALTRAREGKPLLDGDQTVLSRFICAQHVRTPGFFLASRDATAAYIPEAMAEVVEGIRDEHPAERTADTEKDASSTGPRINELVPISMTLFEYDEQHTGVKFEITVGKGLWLETIRHHLDDQSLLMRTLCSHKWSIVEAPEGVSWPTSDKPLVLGVFLPDGSTTCVLGLMEAHILLFPISLKKLLASCLQEKLPSHFTASAEGARLLREMIIKNAFLYVYSACADDEVQKIRPRVVNNEEANRIENALSSWYDAYNEQEAPLLGHQANIVDNRAKKES